MKYLVNEHEYPFRLTKEAVNKSTVNAGADIEHSVGGSVTLELWVKPVYVEI